MGAHPDAASIAALAGRLDPACADTCCVPKLEWVGEWGPPPSADDVSAARSALGAATDPAVISVALRIVSRGGAAADARLFARYVDDERAGASLPTAHPSQQVVRCYPVTWSPSSPSKEALRALGTAYGKTFAAPASYRAWAAANPDPEASFEVWNARLNRREPPSPELVAELRAKGELLFARVMAYRCDGNDRCGIAPTELAKVMKTAIGAARALAWLDGTEKLPEPELGRTYANVIRSGEVLFSGAELPALTRVWSGGTFAGTVHQGMLAVLLSRLDPSNAKKYWRHELARPAAVPAAAGVDVVLQEAARRDPVGMEADLRPWLDHTADEDADAERARALFSGLAASDVRAAPVFGRLVSAPLSSSSGRAWVAVWEAATHFGCTGLGAREALEFHALKLQAPADGERERARSEASRTTFLGAVRACGKRFGPRR